MNLKVIEIEKILSRYGAFARPFINWILEGKIDSSWRHYFTALRHMWKMEHESALREGELGLKRCGKDAALKYLLLTEKLSLFRRLGKLKEGDLLYEKLMGEWRQIPKEVRKDVATVLLNYPALKNGGKEVKGTRIWSKSQIPPNVDTFWRH